MRGSRSILLLFVLLSFSTFCFAQTEQNFSSKKRVAVVDFEDISSFWHGRLGEVAANFIVEQLLKIGYFEVVERQKLGEILKEQSISQTGFIDPDTASQVGKILGVDIIITGSIQRADVTVKRSSYFDRRKNITNYSINATGEVAINLKIVDVNTTKIIFAKTERGSSSEYISTDEKYSDEKNINRSSLINRALDEATSKFFDDFERLYPLSGYATEKNEDEGTVVISLGKKDGVVPGMYFTLFETKKYVISGKEYETIGKKQCNLKIIEVFEDISIARVTGRHYKKTVKRIVVPSVVRSIPKSEGE